MTEQMSVLFPAFNADVNSLSDVSCHEVWTFWVVEQISVSCQFPVASFKHPFFLLHVVKLRNCIELSEPSTKLFYSQTSAFSSGELVFFVYLFFILSFCLCDTYNGLRLFGSLQFVSSLNLYRRYENGETLKNELL